MCRDHPEVEAVARCRSCRAPVCATCDFAVKSFHLCPTCATATPTMSSGRKKLIGWAIGMAVWVTGCLGLLISGVLDNAAGSAVVGLLAFVPCLIGIALSVGAYSRRGPNPPILWVAIAWNSLMTVAYLLLILIGLMMGA